MDVHERLMELLDERGWSEYRLARESGLSDSTIHNIYKRNTSPSIPTLETICKGFGITLSQFFAEGEMVEMTPELKALFEGWRPLTPQQKKAERKQQRAKPLARRACKHRNNFKIISRRHTPPECMLHFGGIFCFLREKSSAVEKPLRNRCTSVNYFLPPMEVAAK